MNRKLLATAIGVALAGGMMAAQAETTLYGNINLSVNYQDPVEGKSDTTLQSNTSSIGVKGSEDLGNGLRAIYQAEFQIDVDDAEQQRYNPTNTKNLEDLSGNTADVGDNSSTDSVLQGRDIWVGAAHDGWGQIRMGTISTTYKSYGAMVDPLYRTSAQGRDFGLQSRLHSGKGEEGQGRATNTFRYDSPSWKGFGVKGNFTLDNSESDGETKNPYSLGAHYMNGPALVFFDWIDSQLGDQSSAWKVGGKYTYQNFGIYGQYENDGGLISQQDLSQIGNTTGADAKNFDVDGRDTWFVGASYKWGNSLFYGAYGQGDKATGSTALDPDVTIPKYKSWEVAWDYAFTKQTDLYVGYVTQNPKGSGSNDVWTAGWRTKF
jgi:predicted porin